MKDTLKLCTLMLGICLAATSSRAASIVEFAASDERFSTLVAAVTAAGLAETLAGTGPFTVYAPLDDAFAALPESTVETPLKPENKARLTNVLLYHVDDRKLSADMIPGDRISSSRSGPPNSFASPRMPRAYPSPTGPAKSPMW